MRFATAPNLLLCALLGTLAACTDDGFEDDDVPAAPVTSTNAPLYQTGTLWPGGIIPVCYDHNDGNNASLLYDARRILETNGWPVVANVRFVGWGACQGTVSDSQGQVRLHFAAGSRGLTAPAPGHPGQFFGEREVTLISDGTTARFTYEVLHEFGHVLGFAHEQERPDNFPNGPGGAPLYCNEFDTGEGVTYGGTYRTPYFDNESIMSYCPRGTYPMELSPGDVLGAQMAYGRRTAVVAGQNPSSNVVARTPDALDTFFVHSDGALWATTWFPDVTGSWPTTAASIPGLAPANAPVAAISRTPDHLDAFYVGNHGEILNTSFSLPLWTSAWVTNPLNSTWQRATPGATIAAVSSAPGQIDVVFAGTDHNLQWSHSLAQSTGENSWGSPRRATSDGSVPTGAHVSVVARKADQLDAFFIGSDGKLHTSYCYNFGRVGPGSCNEDSWISYTTNTAADCLAPPGAPLTAVARTPENLDVFWVSRAGALCTAYWNRDVAFTSYRITAPGTTVVGSKLAAVARTPDNLDVTLVVRNPGGPSTVADLYVARWHTGASAWAWEHAGPIYGGRAVAGQTVAITARRPDVIDLFTLGVNLFTGATTSQSTAYWSTSTGWGSYLTNTY
jgi:hypothetical protein